VEEGFREFLSRLTPSSTESLAAKIHRATVKARLDADYTLYRFLRIGSFGNGTSIYGYSDIDYLAHVSPYDLSGNSSYCLQNLKSSLDARFPRSGVGVRSPAVRVPFGPEGRNATDVVLAYSTMKTASGHRIYGIPDGFGGWMRTAPDVHKAYVATWNNRLGGKVRPLVRFLKAWKFYRNVRVSSFYLEMRVAQYAAKQQTIVYGHDVARCLSWLLDLGLARLQDPCGISGYIAPCRTEIQLDEAMSKLERAATRAANAAACDNRGKTAAAFDWWRLLYDDAFPTYYY
jgi:hypothetical protein